jgi:hypothetical protein
LVGDIALMKFPSPAPVTEDKKRRFGRDSFSRKRGIGHGRSSRPELTEKSSQQWN